MKPRTYTSVTLLLASGLGCAPALAQDVSARSIAASCFTCHGTDGNSVQGVPPSLAGRASAELFQAMKDFQAGKRPATIMHQIAKGYSDDQIKVIAAFFAAQPARK